MHPEFEAEILSGIESLFPRLHDGSVVFKFPRLFFVARKKADAEEEHVRNQKSGSLQSAKSLRSV